MAPSEKIIAGEDTIAGYIPQKPPFVMISSLIEASREKTVTSWRISKDNVLCFNGLMSESGLIENMAQTAAAGVGYLSRVEGKEPPVGFIGGIRGLRIHELPPWESVIRTEVVQEHEVFDASIVGAKIYSGDRCIAECSLKIFLINNIKNEG